MSSVTTKTLAWLVAAGFAAFPPLLGPTPARAAGTSASASADVDSEKLAKVKAAFLLNFIKFTEWPPEKFQKPDAPLTVIVLAGTKETFAEIAAATLRGRKAGEHPVVVRRGPSLPVGDPAGRAAVLRSIASAHVVYIPHNDGTLTPAETRDLNAAAVLTIGATPAESRRDAVLAFDVQQGKVVFLYNGGAARSAKLTLSSKLLSLARSAD